VRISAVQSPRGRAEGDNLARRKLKARKLVYARARARAGRRGWTRTRSFGGGGGRWAGPERGSNEGAAGWKIPRCLRMNPLIIPLG
jgi:hypothetical protein